MSDTPRTNAVTILNCDRDIVPADFARQLERELAEKERIIKAEKTGELISLLNTLAQENKTLRRMSHVDRAERAEADNAALREALLKCREEFCWHGNTGNKLSADSYGRLVDMIDAAIDSARSK